MIWVNAWENSVTYTVSPFYHPIHKKTEQKRARARSQLTLQPNMSESVRLLHISLHWHITGEKHLRFLRGGDITSTPIDTKHTPITGCPRSAQRVAEHEPWWVSRPCARSALYSNRERPPNSLSLSLILKAADGGEEFSVITMIDHEWTTPTSGVTSDWIFDSHIKV